MFHRPSLWVLFGLLLCAWMPAYADEPKTADEVIARYLQAVGGREKLDACKSLRMSGTVALPDGRQGRFVQEHKRPSKFRAEVRMPEGMTIVQAFDGQAGWGVWFGRVVELPPQIAKLLEEQAKDEYDAQCPDGRDGGRRWQHGARRLLPHVGGRLATRDDHRGAIRRDRQQNPVELRQQRYGHRRPESVGRAHVLEHDNEPDKRAQEAARQRERGTEAEEAHRFSRVFAITEIHDERAQGVFDAGPAVHREQQHGRPEPHDQKTGGVDEGAQRRVRHDCGADHGQECDEPEGAP